MRSLLNQVLIFVAWAVTTALAFVVLIAGRSSLVTLLAIAYVGDSVRRGWQVRFWGQAYYVVAGLAFLIFLLAIDGYLKDGRAHSDVLRRFFRVTGIELLILFAAELVVALAQGAISQQLGVVLLPASGLVGVILVGYSIHIHPKRRTAPSSVRR